jgi:hypothetical protein
LAGATFPNARYLLTQQILVVLNASLQQFEVLVCVFLQFAHSHCQVVVFLEDHSLHELFLLFETGLEVVVKFVDFSIDFILQLVEVLLDRCESPLHAFSVLFCILEVISELLRELGKHALHFTVLLCDNFDHFLDFGVDIVAELASPVGRLS